MGGKWVDVKKDEDRRKSQRALGKTSLNWRSAKKIRLRENIGCRGNEGNELGRFELIDSVLM